VEGAFPGLQVDSLSRSSMFISYSLGCGIADERLVK
jgi:hypothetical protein